MKKLSFLFLVCLSFYACKDDSPSKTLPPFTEEGKNRAGFLIDGEVWIPFAECGFYSNPCREISARYGQPSNNANNLSISLTRVNGDKSSSINITFDNLIYQPGDYTKDVNVGFRGEEWSGNAGVYSYYGASFGTPAPSGSFIITRLDTINQVVSGTFEFPLQESNGSGKVKKITDGRFDFQLNACICR